jgi:hypothetical protein
VTYQACDHNLVLTRKASFESEIRQILAEHKDEKFFKDPIDGIWFGGVHKTKSGNATTQKHCTKDSVAYSTHLQ